MLFSPRLMIEMGMPFCWMLEMWDGFGVDGGCRSHPVLVQKSHFSSLVKVHAKEMNDREPANKKYNDQPRVKFLGSILVSWEKP